MIALLLATTALGLALASSANAMTHVDNPNLSAPADACQWRTLDNGCAGHIAGASFQRNPATFPQYATGYDKTTMVPAGPNAALITRAQALSDAIAGTGVFTGAKRIDFDMPGVAYPVGDNPALEKAPSDPTLVLPPSCTYQSTGGGPNANAPRIYCAGAMGTATLSNVDFTNDGSGTGKTCATLEFGSNVSGSLTVDNFRMAYRGKCVADYKKSNGHLILANAPASNFTSLTLKNYTIDTNPQDCAGCLTHPLASTVKVAAAVDGFTLAASYFAMVNNVGRLFEAGNGAHPYHLSVDHFYIEGVSLGCMVYGQHGESEIVVVNGGATGNTQTWRYGAIVIPATSPYYPTYSQFRGRGCLSAPLYFSTGQTGSSWTDEEGWVVSIVNLPAGNRDEASGATVAISYVNFPNSSDIYVHDVWADPHGADSCAANQGSGVTGLGATSPVMNITDLYDGSVVTNFDSASACAGHGT